MRSTVCVVVILAALLSQGCALAKKGSGADPDRMPTRQELDRRNPFRTLGEIESIRLFGAPCSEKPSFLYPKQKHGVVSLTSTVVELPFWALTWVGVRTMLCPQEHEKHMRRARRHASDEGQADAFVAAFALAVMSAGCVGSWTVDVVAHDIPVMLIGWPTEAIIKWRTGRPYPPLPTDIQP